MKSIKDVLQEYISKNLATSEYLIDDIYVITANTLNIKVDILRLNLDKKITDSKKQELVKNLDEYYILKNPLQYITGNVNFFNENYIVDDNVLIPRQDTEILVEEAIKIINKYNLKTALDLCTGSGCIGISVANNSKILSVTLSDISKEALDIAKKNVKKNKAYKVKKYVLSDMLDIHIKEGSKYDIILSNPPYIPTNDIEYLDENVKKEPVLALDGGVLGIDKYLKILDDASKVLNENGYILLEIGYDQKDILKNLINKYMWYEYLGCVKDYGGNDRVVILKYNSTN